MAARATTKPAARRTVGSSPVATSNSTGRQAAPAAVIGATTAMAPLLRPRNSSSAPMPPAHPASAPQPSWSGAGTGGSPGANSSSVPHANRWVSTTTTWADQRRLAMPAA
jgi:hypothetical protein